MAKDHSKHRKKKAADGAKLPPARGADDAAEADNEAEVDPDQAEIDELVYQEYGGFRSKDHGAVGPATDRYHDRADAREAAELQRLAQVKAAHDALKDPYAKSSSSESESTDGDSTDDEHIDRLVARQFAPRLQPYSAGAATDVFQVRHKHKTAILAMRNKAATEIERIGRGRICRQLLREMQRSARQIQRLQRERAARAELARRRERRREDAAAAKMQAKQRARHEQRVLHRRMQRAHELREFLDHAEEECHMGTNMTAEQEEALETTLIQADMFDERRLDLANRGIGEGRCAVMVFAFLKKNESVTAVDLSGNQLRAGSASMLAEVLAERQVQHEQRAVRWAALELQRGRAAREAQVQHGRDLEAKLFAKQELLGKLTAQRQRKEAAASRVCQEVALEVLGIRREIEAEPARFAAWEKEQQRLKVEAEAQAAQAAQAAKEAKEAKAAGGGSTGSAEGAAE